MNLVSKNRPPAHEQGKLSDETQKRGLDINVKNGRIGGYRCNTVAKLNEKSKKIKIKK